MEIGGLQKFSLIDYPGKISAVIFTRGCNFRCPYCHNPELVIPAFFTHSYSGDDISAFLRSRREKLEGIVITGGEPTVQKNLIEFMSEVKDLGFFLKLDTNGSNPYVLKKVISLGLVDFVAMDIKAPFDRYPFFCGAPVDIARIKESINIIASSGLEYEFRTTMVSPYLKFADAAEIASVIGGPHRYKLQKCLKQEKVLNNEFLTEPQYTEAQIKDFQREIEAVSCGDFIPAG